MSKGTPGCGLIVASWAIGFLMFLVVSPDDGLGPVEQLVLVVGPALAGALYLAGVIAWAIHGAVCHELETLQKQNQEMIDLLRRIAAGGQAGTTEAPPPREVSVPGDPPSPSTGITAQPPGGPSPGPASPGGIDGPEELHR